MIPDVLRDAVALATALVLTVLPGAALLRRLENTRDDLLERLGAAAVTSWAVWACLLWIAPPGLWTGTAVLVVAISGAVFATRAVRARRGPGHVAFDAPPFPRPSVPAALLVLLLLSVALRAGTAFHRAPPSTGDLTMHAYMTELVRLADGLPSSHEPLLPIATFGQNSPGLHGIAALISRASAIPSDRAALLVGCLALVVLALALDRVLRTLLSATPRLARGAAAILTILLARNPQLFVTWGGLPTIASIALVFFVFAESLEWTDRFDATRAVRAGVVGAGAVLTHLLPVVAALYVAAPIALVLAARRRSGAALANAALACAVAAALVARFVHRTSLAPSSSTVEWARDWIRGELQHAGVPLQLALGKLPLSPESKELLAFPFFWLVFIGVLGAVALAWFLVRGALETLRSGRLSFVFAVSLAILALLAALHVAALTESVPYWMALYPYRVHLFLLVPVAAAFAAGLAGLLASPRHRPLAGAAAALLVAATALGARFAGPHGDGDLGGIAFDATVRSVRDTMNARVGADDLAAFAWIVEHTPADAVIANNEGDGGQLLPARAGRRVTAPHYQKFWYEEEFTRWAEVNPPGYVFIGAHPSPAYPLQWTAAALDSSGAWDLAFRSGESRVYIRREGAAP